ncbi:MAG: folate family ECF transporter S component [Bacillota bacterium]
MRSLRSLVIAALMSALSVILTRFGSIRISIGAVEGIRLGIGALPYILTGIVLGPIYGALAGGIADLVGFFLSPIGGYMPHFTLTAALIGAIPGTVFRLLQRGSRNTAQLLPLFCGIGASTVLVSWGLTPYFLHTLFGLDLRVIMVPRIVAGLVELPVYAFIVRAVYDRTRPLLRDR